ncbi:MAG: PDZ domain-containing protein, partial [Gammaproteobacteria bacterium]|nr:PDZ domain-containing protein [Gammaproteobacteria bacterium]
AAIRPGAEAALSVWRDGKERNIRVTVAELTEEKQSAALERRKSPEEHPARASVLGLTVRPLAPAEKEQAHTQGGLLVEGVSGPAQAAEVEAGDIILGVNGKRVASVPELEEAARGAGKSVALLIQREDAQIFVPLRLP